MAHKPIQWKQYNNESTGQQGNIKLIKLTQPTSNKKQISGLTSESAWSLVSFIYTELLQIQ
jgi:hypothetical protein